MATTITLVPLGTYPAGTYTETAAIPTGVQSVTFTITAPKQAAFQAQVDWYLSADGGNTWRWAGGASAEAIGWTDETTVACVGYDHIRAVATLATSIRAAATATTAP